ncbi:hypothetical protein T440DRAFT_494721 [Plenodomus tracheiphilus IPT5]|uniref:MARVEL domain-containing protein n=1 Tax=Plenodomus tracheiphilus IPT5 TaxID=1408161 RepID=A0A6A7BR54_9PLEO|nr:hypothetical protein T440DRAFT_494721 [Plenodomus tracheiphilus IPT5]
MLSGKAKFVPRGFQALFASIVIGLSVTLIRGHHVGSLPWQLGFACFASSLALTGSFLSLLEGIVGLTVDVVVAAVNFSGGIEKYRCTLEQEASKFLLDRCREAQASSTFMFLTAVVLLVGGMLLFSRARKGS